MYLNTGMPAPQSTHSSKQVMLEQFVMLWVWQKASLGVNKFRDFGGEIQGVWTFLEHKSQEKLEDVLF